MSDKVHSREGKSPEHKLRSQIFTKCEKKLLHKDDLKVGLETAILNRKRNSS